MLERLQVQVYEELTWCKMDGILRKRAILPRRFEGAAPGVSPVVETACVASAMLLEAFIGEHVARADSSGHELPLGIRSPKARLDQRAQMAVGDYTSLEKILRQATEAVKIAANGHSGFLSRKEPAIPVPLAACLVGSATGPAASALAAVDRDTPVEFNGHGSRPAPFHELGRARGKQRDLASSLWVAYFYELFQAAGSMSRVLQAEGASAGSGLFFAPPPPPPPPPAGGGGCFL